MIDEKKPNYNMIAVIATFFMTSMMGTRPLVPLFANELEASTIEIGLIISMFPILPLLFAVYIGRIVDRIGCKVPIIWNSILSTFALMIPFVLPTLTGLFVSQLVMGLTSTFFIVAAQSYVGHSGDGKKRELNVMKFSIGNAIGSFIGPLAGGYLADWIGTPQAFLTLGIASLVSFVLSLSIVENGKPKDSLKKAATMKLSATLDLLKISNVRRAFLISALILMGKDIFTSYFPLLAVEFGLSGSTIGMIIAINALAGIIIRWLMPQLLGAFGRNVVIIGSIVSAGVFFIVLPFFQNEVLLGLISFLLGIGLGLGQPLSISTTMFSLPEDRMAEGLGLRLTANRFTQATAPFLFGVLAQVFTLASVFFVTGSIILAGSMKTRIQEESPVRHKVG